MSQPYFDNTLAPGVSDAEVRVIDENGEVLTFESQGDGNYTWTPVTGTNIGEPGMRFTLDVQLQGDLFQAESLSRIHI